MKALLLLLTLFTFTFTSENALAQIPRPSLPQGIGITAGLWNTRIQSGTSLSLDMPRFGLDFAMHQEFLSDLTPHATSLLAGHSNKTDRWLTFARAGVLYDWQQQLPGLTAETGLSWRLHEKVAFNFTLHGDLTKTGLIAGSRFGVQTHL